MLPTRRARRTCDANTLSSSIPPLAFEPPAGELEGGAMLLKLAVSGSVTVKVDRVVVDTDTDELLDVCVDVAAGV